MVQRFNWLQQIDTERSRVRDYISDPDQAVNPANRPEQTHHSQGKIYPAFITLARASRI